MTAHTKKHDIDATDDHNGVSGGTSNGLVVFDANGLPKEPTTDIVAGQKITSVTTPAADGDAANMGFVMSSVEGMIPKVPSNAASVGDLTLSGEQTVDGIALVADDVCLAKDQATPAENGLYAVVDGAWVRTDDMAIGASASGARTFITEGTVNGGRAYTCNNAIGSGTVGTHDLTFIQTSALGQVTAGSGLTKTGDTIDAIGGDGITANADDLAVDLAAAGVGVGGLEIATAEIQILTDGAHGIILTATGVEIELEASKGLSVGASGLAVVIEASKGLSVGASGLATVIKANSGLTVDGDGLQAVLEANKGLSMGASGLAIDPDGTTGVTVAPITLNANGAGVTVDNDTIGHTGGSIHVNSGGIILQPDVDTLTGATPVRADVSGWANGDKGIGIGTDGSIWLLYRKTDALVYSVDMTEVGS